MKLNKFEKIMIGLFAVCLCFMVGISVVVWSLYQDNRSMETSTVISEIAKEETMKYTLYIGTNDKDTYEQIVPTEEAIMIVNKICTEYVGGYTAMNAKGGWVDEAKELTQENTLVYSFYEITEEQITAIMDDILEALNQNSILIEAEQVHSNYYYGKKK